MLITKQFFPMKKIKIFTNYFLCFYFYFSLSFQLKSFGSIKPNSINVQRRSIRMVVISYLWLIYEKKWWKKIYNNHFIQLMNHVLDFHHSLLFFSVYHVSASRLKIERWSLLVAEQNISSIEQLIMWWCNKIKPQMDQKLIRWLRDT